MKLLFYSTILDNETVMSMKQYQPWTMHATRQTHQDHKKG